MKDHDLKNRIFLIKGDITLQTTDAIVNAANKKLLGGEGVDGAIHRAAGRQLLEECRTLGGCETGEAKLTKGYRLKAKYVIHTVGPVWQGGNKNEAEKLAACYRNSLKLASDTQDIASIAFPAISCGIYGYPIEEAAKIAIHEVSQFLLNNADIKQVTFVCFDNASLDIYRHEYKSG